MQTDLHNSIGKEIQPLGFADRAKSIISKERNNNSIEHPDDDIGSMNIVVEGASETFHNPKSSRMRSIENSDKKSKQRFGGSSSNSSFRKPLATKHPMLTQINQEAKNV